MNAERDPSGPLQKILAANPRRIAHWDLRAPTREFLILFTARSGSSHLSELLTSAGVGDVREWLNPDFLAGQAQYFGATTFDDYFQRMRSACPDGVFGQKMTITFYEAFSRETRLERYFDFRAPTILLFRDNIIEQAVSAYLANERQHFHKISGTEHLALPAVRYVASEICRYADALCREEERLRGFVEEHACAPRFVSYEQMIEADPATVITAVADLVGATPLLSRMQSRHQKLGDAENVAMAEQFIEDNLLFCDGLHTRRQWLYDGLDRQPLLGV